MQISWKFWNRWNRREYTRFI